MSAIAKLNETIRYMDINSPRYFDYIFTRRAEAGLKDTEGDRYLLSNRDIKCTLADMVADLPTLQDILPLLDKTYIPLGKGDNFSEYHLNTDNLHRWLIVHNDTIVLSVVLSVDKEWLDCACIGSPKAIVSIMAMYRERYNKRRTVNYRSLLGFGNNGAIVKDNHLTQEVARRKIAFDAFYPFIEGGLEKLVADYQASDCSVLLLLGAPGLGKTSLIRTLTVLLNKNNNILVNDEQVILNPGFMAFLHGLEDDITISIEDAQRLLEKRDNGNIQMSSFLSLADGIMSSNNKIMISTNLTSLTSIDEPLYRPGRLFTYINFRKLTPTEANAARAAIDLEPLDFESDVSLAEALNGTGIKGYGNRVQVKTGF